MTPLTQCSEFRHLAVRYDRFIPENSPHNGLNIETSSYLLHTFYAFAGKYASFALLEIFDARLYTLCSALMENHRQEKFFVFGYASHPGDAVNLSMNELLAFFTLALGVFLDTFLFLPVVCLIKKNHSS